MKSNLILRAINQYFGPVHALKDIDLEVGAGEFIAILGPSGCGKTTLLRLIAGFEKPSQGEILVNGETVASDKGVKPPEQRRIGMVFQSFALWPHLTVCENVAFPLKYQSDVPEEFRANPKKRIQDVLHLVGLSGYERRYPNQLSGGQRQRVAIARAIAATPALLLMDEPLSSLDPELRIQMRKEIQDLHRQLGTSIVYVTHDQSEALAMADRIVVMKEGKIEQVGTPEAVYFSPRTKFVASFVGNANFLTGKWIDEHMFSFSLSNQESFLIQTNGDYAGFHPENVLPVRPEQIHLSAVSPDRQDVLCGIIENVQFQGRDLLYSVRVGNDRLDVLTKSADRFRRNEMVQVEIHV